MAKKANTTKAEQGTGISAVVTGVEVAALSAAIKGLESLWKMQRDRRTDTKPCEPLQFAVIQAVWHDDVYVLFIACYNQGPHGVYLRDAAVKKPFELKEFFSPAKKKMASFGTEEPNIPLPIYVPPAEMILVQAHLTGLAEDRQGGKLDITYVVLGCAKAPAIEHVEFAYLW